MAIKSVRHPLHPTTRSRSSSSTARFVIAIAPAIAISDKEFAEAIAISAQKFAEAIARPSGQEFGEPAGAAPSNCCNSFSAPSISASSGLTTDSGPHPGRRG